MLGFSTEYILRPLQIGLSVSIAENLSHADEFVFDLFNNNKNCTYKYNSLHFAMEVFWFFGGGVQLMTNLE